MLDFLTATAPYWVGAIAYTVWYAIAITRGGENSILMRQSHANPALRSAPLGIVLLVGLLGIVIRGALWLPCLFLLDLPHMLRRRKPTAFLHKDLTAVYHALTGHEKDYERILAAHDLANLTRALHAVDLGAVHSDVTYEDIIGGALDYVTVKQMWEQGKQDEAKTFASAALARRHSDVSRAGDVIGAILIGYIIRWLPERVYDNAKKWYAEHVRGDANADLIHEVFAPITITSAVNVVEVQVTDSGDSDRENAV